MSKPNTGNKQPMTYAPFRLKKRLDGPPSPVLTRPGLDGEACQIVFGANADVKKVLMQFNVSADRLIFSPEEALDVAAKLTHYAGVANGTKAN